MPVSLGGTAIINNQSGTSASTAAMSPAPTTGSVISVAVSWNGLTNCTGVTDTAGNTYVSAGAKVGNGDKYHQVWYAKNVATHASNVVTPAFSASSTQIGISVVEVKGAHLTSPLGLYGGRQQGPGITTANGTTSGALGTPAQDGHFVHGCSTSNGGTTNFNVGTGYTSAGNTGGGNYRVVAGYLIQTTAAAVEALFTQDNTATTTTVAATYRPSPGPSITTQPTAQTSRLNGDTSTAVTFSFECSAAITSVLWEIETSVGSGSYTTISNGGIYAISTNLGAGSGSLTATPTDDTNNGKRIRVTPTNADGSTVSNAVVWSVLDGPVLSAASATTNGSGVASVTMTSDDALSANGEILLVTASINGTVIARTTVRPA